MDRPLSVLAVQEAQAQRVQLDESLGVALVIDGVFLEGHMLHRLERVGRLAAFDDDVALVELQAHRAVYPLLALGDQRLQHLALGRPPETDVDLLRIVRYEEHTSELQSLMRIPYSIFFLNKKII